MIFFSFIFQVCLAVEGFPTATIHAVFVGSSSLLPIVFKRHLFVYRDDSLKS